MPVLFQLLQESELSGFSGDGGPALNAKFAYPEELSMDEAGNIYVADSEDARVRR